MLKKLFTRIGGICISIVLFTTNAFITIIHLSNVKTFYGNRINALLNKQTTFLLEVRLTYATKVCIFFISID
uniref:Col_cuticle_N domain-containing protein n=1 Tax=Ascaris lumbricoides TaxID=6252 RepID=A0A0M3ITK0_ASCLU